jgi:hypothetical protein
MSYYSSSLLPYSSYSRPYLGIEELDSNDSVVSKKLYSYRASSPSVYDYPISRRYTSDLLSPALSSYYYPRSSYYSSSLYPYYSSYSSSLPYSYRYHYSYNIPALVHRPYQPIINRTYRLYAPNYTYVTPPPPAPRIDPPVYNYHYHPAPRTSRTTVTRTVRSYSVPPPIQYDTHYRYTSVPRFLDYTYY